MPQDDRRPYPTRPSAPQWSDLPPHARRAHAAPPVAGHYTGYSGPDPRAYGAYDGHRPPPPEPRNGLGLASIILGLVGILLGLVPLTGWLAAAVGITGLVLGAAGVGRLRRRRATNRKTTFAGLAASAIALGLGIWGIAIVFGAVDQLGKDLENLGGGEISAEDAATTAQDAMPAGQLVEVGDWRVAVRAANLDAAEVVAAANQFNEPPPEGSRLVMARADVAYAGQGTSQPWLDLQFKILGGKGNTFDTVNGDCGVIPSPLTDVGEMTSGATAAGNVCIVVPADQLEGAVWVVEQTVTGKRASIALQ